MVRHFDKLNDRRLTNRKLRARLSTGLFDFYDLRELIRNGGNGGTDAKPRAIELVRIAEARRRKAKPNGEKPTSPPELVSVSPRFSLSKGQ